MKLTLAGIFDAPSAPAAPPPFDDDEDGDDGVPADGEAPICPEHGTPMKRSKFGGWYCPQRIDEDEFCPEKVKPKAKAKRRRR